MKISLCMLRNWLKPYHPELHTLRICEKQRCSDDCIQIQEVRLYNHNDITDRSTVFIGRESDFFETDSSRVVCHYTESDLFLNTTDLISVFNEILNAFSFYENWGARLRQMIEQQCTLTELLDLSEPLLQNPLFVLDSSDTIIGFTSKYEDNYIDSAWENLMTKKHSSPEEAFVFHNEENQYFHRQEQEPFFIPRGLFPRNTYSQNLFISNEWCGICSMCEFTSAFDLGQMHVFKILSNYVQLWINRQSSRALLKMDETLFADLVHGHMDAAEPFSRKLSTCGWNADDELVLLAARPISSNYSTQSYLSLIFENHSRFIRAVTVNQDIIVLYNRSQLNETDFFQFLTPWLIKGSYCCGISYSFLDIKKIPDIYRQTQFALKCGNLTPGSRNHIQDYALKWYIHLMQNNPLMPPLHPALLKMQQHDTAHNSRYVQTLFTFLKNERNIKLSSEELKIHRNTLCQRISRIETQFLLHLDDPDERLYLLLSCYALEFSKEYVPNGHDIR